MSVNQTIKNYLESKGISQSVISRRANIPKATLNRLLEEDEIKLSQYLKICEALDLSFGFFLPKEFKESVYNTFMESDVNYVHKNEGKQKVNIGGNEGECWKKLAEANEKITALTIENFELKSRK